MTPDRDPTVQRSPGAVRASVIVPARNCPDVLRSALLALHGSDLPRDAWELVVVDDGSTDRTPDVAAELADCVVRLAAGPHGPAFARNRGAEVAAGDCLVFVDSDVCVHPDTIRRLVETLEGPDAPAAVFGAYDTCPAAPGVVSQYRNLLHHYVHRINPGDAETFWAGCGAVRRAVFVAVGMFDQRRYPRPQIEDIELGYRLRDSRWRIVLDPEIQGTHLKHWTLRRVLTTDFADRAVPWTRLLYTRRALGRPGMLNLHVSEQVYTALTGGAAVLLLGALVSHHARWLAVVVALLLPVIFGNQRLLHWFAQERGIPFAIAVVPLRLLFYLTSGAGAAWAIAGHALEQLRRSFPVSLRGATQ